MVVGFALFLLFLWSYNSLMISERWGEKYVDRRDWPVYNKVLVGRGALLVNSSVLDVWQRDLAEMNLGKYGRPYVFPDALFLWAALLHTVFDMPYRQIQGYLEKSFPGVKVPCYATLYNRINSIDFKGLFDELEVKKKRGLL